MTNVNYLSKGPTEAERKIEELTRQLEEEMEKQEEEGEYFGMKILLIRDAYIHSLWKTALIDTHVAVLRGNTSL